MGERNSSGLPDERPRKGRADGGASEKDDAAFPEPTKAEHLKSEPSKPEHSKLDSPKTENVRSEHAKPEGPKADLKGEILKLDPSKADPSKAESSKAERVDDSAREVSHPSIPPPPPAGPWRSYKEIVAQLAARIVEGQKPIRVLQSIRWDNAVEEQFFRSRARELPQVDVAYYGALDLGFEPRSKMAEFDDIARDIERELGSHDAIGSIMTATALEYRDVVRMLAARGTPVFYAYSRKLYGSPKDKFPDGKTTVRDFGHLLYSLLTHINEHRLGDRHERTIDAAECAAELNGRFARYFADSTVRVQVDDTILADAAAGSDYVKVRTGAMFSPRDIDILEVHEGWVHVATSLNGEMQTVAQWLAKGPPRTATVQEGLAALLEIFTFRTYPRRARRLNDRVLAVDKAEDGASFLEVFEWFRTEGYEEDECFNNTRRIFRGGIVGGGAPFTKDACYCKGIVLNYAFIRSAIQQNRIDLIPYLFVGKVAHEDVPILARRVADGVIKPPHYLPPMFRDLNGLAIWMAYSTFFSQLGGDSLTEYYARLFERS